MTDIVDLNKKRKPVTYTVHVTHHWDGIVETFVEDVSDDDRSRGAVAEALERVALAYRKTHPADGMHAILLAMINLQGLDPHYAGDTDDDDPDAWEDFDEECEEFEEEDE